MALSLILALQAAAAPAPPLAGIDFDLARYSRNEPGLGASACRREPSEIVVCARREAGAYPLEEMARIFEPGRLIAETRLTGNLTGNVHVEQVEMPDRGAVARRIMFELTLPF